MRENIKLSFTGDVMCEAIQIDSHRIKENKYNFDDIFSSMKEFFQQSNYVIANLETPIGGEKLGYGNKKYSFNTPESFLDSIKNCGINLVTTANNHCLDRGVEGLEETIRNLDSYQLKHIGTYSHKKKEPFIEEIDGIKVGFLSYTYGTNAFFNQNYLKRNESYMVNLFQAQELGNRFTRYCYNNPTKLHSRIYNKIYRILFPNQAKLQVYERKSSSFMYMRNLRKEIKQLKKSGAEYIVACMHMGGQYNSEPNDLTLKVTNKVIQYGANAVIGHHEHVIHKCDCSDKTKIKTYSLGNFSGLAGVLKEPYDKLAEYSIIFNLYLSKENNKVAVAKCTFTIVKSISNGEGKVKTVLLYDLINDCRDELQYKNLLDDNLKIYNLFLNKNVEKIELEREYEIY